MKRFIICFILVISIIFGLCACIPTVIDETGTERDIHYGYFAVIESKDDGYTLIVYDTATKVVYYLQRGGYNGFLSPYTIYQDGALYGAIYQDGKIIPAPYAYAPLE